jgi:RHS repeat-associated protein
VGFGYRGELHVGDLVYLRNRDLDPTTGRFTTPDQLDGSPGTTTTANPYHYAANNPVAYVDPLGLYPSDGDIDGDLAEPDRSILDDLNVVAAAGFPFWLFNPWHRAVQLDLAAQVGGQIECPIPGGGPNGGVGRADVCTAIELWEVKYFGPLGLQSALDQLARYRAVDPRAPGHIVPPSTLTAAGVELFAFSPAPGVRLYMPVPWIRVLERDPVRADQFKEAVSEEFIKQLLVDAGALPDWATDGGGGFQLPHIELPHIDLPDVPSWVPGGALGGAIFLCIMFCIPDPLPII